MYMYIVCTVRMRFTSSPCLRLNFRVLNVRNGCTTEQQRKRKYFYVHKYMAEYCTSIHTYVHTYVSICVCTYVRIYMYVCMYVRMCMYIRICTILTYVCTVQVVLYLLY